MANSISDPNKTSIDHNAPRSLPGLLCCNGLTNLLLIVIAGVLIWMQTDVGESQTLQNGEESIEIASYEDSSERLGKVILALEAISEDIDLMYRSTRSLQKVVEPMARELRLIQENTEAIFNTTAELLDLGSR